MQRQINRDSSKGDRRIETERRHTMKKRQKETVERKRLEMYGKEHKPKP